MSATPSSDKAPFFLTAHDLVKICGGPARRSLASCRKDYRILREELKVRAHIPGIPLIRYAEYIGVSQQEVIRMLNQTQQE